jgi:hypothetical protein
MKKNVSKKLVPKSKPKVTMLEYSIEMTIPTGNFANIRPRIVVEAQTPEDALNYISPHMNRMWKEYFMVNERRQEVSSVVQEQRKATVSPSGPTSPSPCPSPSGPTSQSVEAPPTSNTAVIKATNAIESCVSLEALDLIKNQVELSTKILKEEKPALRKKIVMRFNELNADEFIKRNS